MNLKSELFQKFCEAGKTLRKTALQRDKDAVFDLTIWQNLSDLKIHDLLCGEAGSHSQAALAFYGLAYGSLDLPFCMSAGAHGLVFSDLFFTFASEGQKRNFSPGFLSGKKIGAICNSEEGAGTNLKNIESTAKQIDSDTVVLDVFKPCTTNLPIADVILASVKMENLQGQSSIEIFILRGDEVQKTDIASKIMGFRTGSTGSFRANELKLSIAERGLTIGRSGELLRRCFYVERLYVSVIACGLLHGVEDELKVFLSKNPHLADKQYMQEKLIKICSARIKMQGILQSILSTIDSKPASIISFGKELSVLKMIVNEECYNAGKSYLDALGSKALFENHEAQKILRDLAVLSYFGGTSELQKMSLFSELLREVDSPKLKLSA